MISEQERFAAFRRDIKASNDPKWLRRQLSVEFVEPKAVRVLSWAVWCFTWFMIGVAITLMCAASFPGAH